MGREYILSFRDTLYSCLGSVVASNSNAIDFPLENVISSINNISLQEIRDVSFSSGSATATVSIRQPLPTVSPVTNVRFEMNSLNQLSLAWDVNPNDRRNIEGYIIYVLKADETRWIGSYYTLPIMESARISSIIREMEGTDLYKFKIVTVGKNGYTNAEVIPNMTLNVTADLTPTLVTNVQFDTTTEMLTLDGTFNIGSEYPFTVSGRINYYGSISATNNSQLLIDCFNLSLGIVESSSVKIREMKTTDVSPSNASVVISPSKLYTPIDITSGNGDVAPMVDNIRFNMFDGSLELVWDNPQDTSKIEEYMISLSSDNGETWKEIITVPVSFRSLTLPVFLSDYSDSVALQFKIRSIGKDNFTNADRVSYGGVFLTIDNTEINLSNANWDSVHKQLTIYGSFEVGKEYIIYLNNPYSRFISSQFASSSTQISINSLEEMAEDITSASTITVQEVTNTKIPNYHFAEATISKKQANPVAITVNP